MENNINHSNGVNGNLFNTNTFKFLNAIEDFLLKKSHTNWLADIYKMGLNVYRALPDVKYASIFILLDDDFLFENKLTIPNEFENEATLLYDILLNEGFIGTSLVELCNTVFEIDESHQFPSKGIIIPLIVSTRVLGIVIIITDNIYIIEKQEVQKLISIFTSLLAVFIENVNILRNIENTQSLLEQKIAQRTLDLTQNQRELKTILDSVLAGIIVYDEWNNEIIKTNPIAQNLIGLSEKELIGRSVNEFLEIVNFISDENTISQSKYSYESQLTNIRKVRIPILRSTTKLFLSNKNVIIESFVDLSEIKRYEEELKNINLDLENKIKLRTEDLQLLVHKLKIEVAERERAEKEIKRLYQKEKELNELKSKFVNLVSHEFRTPLTIIKSSTQMFQKFGNKLNIEEKEFYYNRIIKTVDYLNDLIENSLFIGKSENNDIALNKNSINLNNFIKNIVTDFVNSFDKNRTVEILMDKDITFESDERLLYLIINNLLTNAHKYSPKDKKILIECFNEDNNILLKFIDEGIGISKEEIDKIFEHFYRGSNTNNIVGTGLGLAVVKESISKLNGKIWVESEINKGSTFFVQLPIQ